MASTISRSIWSYSGNHLSVNTFSLYRVYQEVNPNILTTDEILIPRYGIEAIECQSNIGSIEVQSQSIIGDGFETHPCPQDYPGCMVVRWEQSDSHETTMCHFHKIKHNKE